MVINIGLLKYLTGEWVELCVSESRIMMKFSDDRSPNIFYSVCVCVGGGVNRCPL